jgi:CspA family cold shock protein
MKFFNEQKGFGIISRDDGGDDVFVHITNCADSIQAFMEGQCVRFDERISKRNGKPEAIAVALL